MTVAAGQTPRRHYADGPFGQIHFLDTGSGVPLVLIHQAPMNAHQFDAVFAPLSACGIRSIAIDLPGFGQSDPTKFVPTIYDYAHTVPAVLDHLALGSANLLGHHTGALVATEAAISYPERIGRLILNGPMPLTDAERAAFMIDMELRERSFTIRADGTHLSEAFAGRAQFSANGVALARINDYIIWMVGSLGPFWYGHNAAFQYDHTPRIAILDCATLILTNTGDAIFEHAKRTKDLRPDWPMITLEGGGIDVTDQLPMAWVTAVAGFLHPAGGE